MSEIRKCEGGVKINGARFGIVAARFNSFVVDSLLAGTLETLIENGAAEKDITVAHVAGAFEIPLACQQMATSGNYDAIIALGAVIRGGTPHFEYVAGECTKGLMQVMLEHNIPVAFGVLTVDTIEQAVERSVEGEGNKGAEATLAVIDLLNLLPQLSK